VIIYCSLSLYIYNLKLVCLYSPLNNSSELKDYLENIITGAAQYNYEAPRYLISDMCRAIDGAANGTDTLGRIYAGVVASSNRQINSCCDMNEFNAPSETTDGWGWQVAFSVDITLTEKARHNYYC
jgi:lysosomal Pro-X carboxypeptidase